MSSKTYGGKSQGADDVSWTAPFSSATMHQHLLKLRDILFSSLPPFASTQSVYDPTSFALGAGSTLYASVSAVAETDKPAGAASTEEGSEEKGTFLCALVGSRPVC